MSIETLAAYATVFFILLGAAFMIIGAIGMLKFNDSMTRLHAPTKVGTMGVGSLLLASMIHAGLIGQGSIHEMLILAFLFVTAPISANFMAKVNIHRRACDTPPDLPDGGMWSTLNVPEADREIEPGKDA